jgi:hypothetical protein
LNILYEKEGKLYCSSYIEIYIPTEYFDNNNFAIIEGSTVETLGIVYIREYKDGKEQELKFLNIPTSIKLMLYENEQEEIKVRNKPLKVLTLKYLKDSYVLNQSITRDKKIAERFLNLILMGKLPKTIAYPDVINLWLKNLEISGVDFKVPIKIYEMIIANIYRNANNMKERFGQVYGKQTNPTGYGYATGNVRDIVENLSTFSGFIYEDINRMITSGINNSLDNVEEQQSPLEKIIYY